jgi:hypothetical protein
MARNPYRRSLSRQLDVIRKRYNRNAARYEKEAASASPAMADALMSAAQNERAKANMYRSKRGESIQSLEAKVAQGMNESAARKASNIRDTNSRKELLASIRMEGNGSSKFYAATQALWRGKNVKNRDAAIIDYFNANAGNITKETKDKFKEQYGYSLELPMDLLDIQNLIELNTGVDIDASSKQPREEYETFKRLGALAVAKMKV